jgi:hypothetical protein
MNRTKLIASLLVTMLVISLFCLYVVATDTKYIQNKDTSERRGADVSFLLVLGAGAIGIATFKLLNNSYN